MYGGGRLLIQAVLASANTLTAPSGVAIIVCIFCDYSLTSLTQFRFVFANTIGWRVVAIKV
jgi:hypothetical protein